MTTADTISLRETLLEELRRSSIPLSTAELAQRMPWKVERSHVPCAQLCHLKRLGPGIRIVECHVDWHLVAYRRTTHGYTGVYRHLRSLEGHGLLRRTIRDGRKRVCWTLVEPPGLTASAVDAVILDDDDHADERPDEEPDASTTERVAC
ncbi:hypothetical protein [Mycolicibacterium frederiksbergense]|uniref:Transcriptional regulator n=1 Tax=Mycolicibacterium frederiksbergense TaxID=117567 RepID=A0A6H0RYB4_9MYCO|nr:hypothetical protein [Mycolicibacterium frederiksbergense]QIV79906.1 hypothetical protein EXE63_02560 [Mycolicibacterium frederiksbergense]